MRVQGHCLPELQQSQACAQWFARAVAAVRAADCGGGISGISGWGDPAASDPATGLHRQLEACAEAGVSPARSCTTSAVVRPGRVNQKAHPGLVQRGTADCLAAARELILRAERLAEESDGFLAEPAVHAPER